MPGWITNAAKNLKDERKRREAMGELQEAQREASTANVRPAFERLRGVVTEDVAEINQEFPEFQKQLSIGSVGEQGFQVVRQYPPAYAMNVTSGQNPPSLYFDIRRPSPIDGKIISTTGSFNVVLDSNDLHLALGIKTLTFEEASKYLLIPALENLE